MAKSFVKTLNKHVPLRTKLIPRNHQSFITKKLRKAIIKQSPSKKKANISNNPEIKKLFEKKRNYVVNLSKKVKTEYFQKHMPQFCKAFFSNKTTNFDVKIILVDNLLYQVSKNEEITTHFNNYFIDITKRLNIKKSSISDKLPDDLLATAI